MNFRISGAVVGCCLLVLASGATVAVAEIPAKPATAPVVEELGQGRYRVGTIEVDKQRQSFSVPGQVLAHENQNIPMEFLAGTRGGLKNYETVFELDTSAIAFNVACLLIGLDAKRANAPQFHFDMTNIDGDRVNITLRWEHDGKRIQIKGEEAMRHHDQGVVSHEWVYTGSRIDPDGLYAAEKAGTLIGFVHEPNSIIQHRKGLGLGRYGSVTLDTTVLPPPGTQIVLSIERVAIAGDRSAVERPKP